MPLETIMAMTPNDLLDVRDKARRIIGKQFSDDNLRTFLLMAEQNGCTIEEQLQRIAETRVALRQLVGKEHDDTNI